MAEESQFKCLRCGHEYRDQYNPGEVAERSCPNCRSNSVRRIKVRLAQKSGQQDSAS